MSPAWFTILNQKGIIIKPRFILFVRSGTYYFEDSETGQQGSLRTKDKFEAQRLINAKNEAIKQPMMNLRIA